MQLSNLTDQELIQHAWAEQDALTRTDLEAELLKRFEACAEFGSKAAEYDIDDAEELGKQLDKAAALDEMTEPLKRLAELTAPA